MIDFTDYIYEHTQVNWTSTCRGCEHPIVHNWTFLHSCFSPQWYIQLLFLLWWINGKFLSSISWKSMKMCSRSSKRRPFSIRRHELKNKNSSSTGSQSFMAEIEKISAHCNYIGYTELFLTYPPTTPVFLLPGKSENTEDCQALSRKFLGLSSFMDYGQLCSYCRGFFSYFSPED